MDKLICLHSNQLHFSGKQIKLLVVVRAFFSSHLSKLKRYLMRYINFHSSLRKAEDFEILKYFYFKRSSSTTVDDLNKQG